MTPIDTAELERLAESITPGPWDVDGEDQGSAWGMAWSVHAAPNILNVVADGVDCEDDARAIALVPALIREVLAHRKAEAWQPIETAPKDGTVVLVYVPDFERVTEAWFCQQTGLWPKGDAYSDEGEPINVGLPTHWCPLPAPPATPEAEGGCDAE